MVYSGRKHAVLPSNVVASDDFSINRNGQHRGPMLIDPAFASANGTKERLTIHTSGFSGRPSLTIRKRSKAIQGFTVWQRRPPEVSIKNGKAPFATHNM